MRYNPHSRLLGGKQQREPMRNNIAREEPTHPFRKDTVFCSCHYYAHADRYWDDVQYGRLPLFPRHVYLERIPENCAHPALWN